MDYASDILHRLLDIYERRNIDRAQPDERVRAVALDVAKTYPTYRDPYSTAEKEIAAAIVGLVDRQFIQAARNAQGYYVNVTLELSRAEELFAILQRTPVADVRRRQADILEAVCQRTEGAARQFCLAQLARLRRGKTVEFGIGDDVGKLQTILLALEGLIQLSQETYVRNFSEAVFHDSKKFQKIQGTVQRILSIYTEEPVGEKDVLEQYNLFETPAYILLKGGWKLQYKDAAIDVATVPGGLGIPSGSLGAIRCITLNGDTVISVENLTTYHDVSEQQGAILYLGGFQNKARTELLKQLYQDSPNAFYYHKGDLDPYGFLILENLKRKTGIPFQALDMDMETLQHCYYAGYYRPLDAMDQKAIHSPHLSAYADIFTFMVKHNCKIEQECFEAMKLGI